ncbi:unannotated protein [freshwater metagenome]|uniref:Unannotated protein n=1 Tax=freshwater metagenome TaxID=449393 RepID=A0A6J7FD07_9ZZZZ
MASNNAGGASAPKAARSSNVAGRLLTMFDATAAMAAAASKDTKVVSDGRIRASQSPIGPVVTPSTTMPRRKTKPQKGRSAPRRIARGVVWRARSAGIASAIDPTAATQNGSISNSPATANPTRVAPRMASVLRGAGTSSVLCSVAESFGVAVRVRSSRKKIRNTASSMATAKIHGSAISAVKCRKVRPVAAKASRLVRFDTGSKVDAELDRCAVA